MIRACTVGPTNIVRFSDRKPSQARPTLSLTFQQLGSIPDACALIGKTESKENDKNEAIVET